MNISDLLIELHNKARDLEKVDWDLGFKVRILADELAQIGNKAHERGYEE